MNDGIARRLPFGRKILTALRIVRGKCRDEPDNLENSTERDLSHIGSLAAIAPRMVAVWITGLLLQRQVTGYTT